MPLALQRYQGGWVEQGVSLEWDDLYLIATNELAELCRGLRGGTETRRLTTLGLHYIGEPPPAHLRGMRGNFRRNLALAQLRRGRFAPGDVLLHLEQALADYTQTGDSWMAAHAHLLQAQVYDQRTRDLASSGPSAHRPDYARLEAALDAAFTLLDAQQPTSSVLHVKFAIDAAMIALAQGTSFDQQRLQRAANDCIVRGYRGQAQKLLRLLRRDQPIPVLPAHFYGALLERFPSLDRRA